MIGRGSVEILWGLLCLLIFDLLISVFKFFLSLFFFPPELQTFFSERLHSSCINKNFMKTFLSHQASTVAAFHGFVHARSSQRGKVQDFDDFDLNFTIPCRRGPSAVKTGWQRSGIGGRFLYPRWTGRPNQGSSPVRPAPDGSSRTWTFNPGAADVQDCPFLFLMGSYWGGAVQPDGQGLGSADGFRLSFAGSGGATYKHRQAQRQMEQWMGRFNPTFRARPCRGPGDAVGRQDYIAGTNVFRINTDGTRVIRVLTFPFKAGLNAVKVQPGREAILVAGFFTTINGQTNRELARVNSNGTVDTSFNYSPHIRFFTLMFLERQSSDRAAG